MTTATPTPPALPALPATTAEATAQSFEQVYAALHLSVLGLARGHLHLAGSGARAGVYGVAGVSPEDIAQQTWLQVWRHWPSLEGRPMSSVASYVLRTAHHLVIDQQRRRVLRGRVGEVALTADLWEIVNDTVASTARETHPEAAALDAELCAEARAALAQMRAALAQMRVRHAEQAQMQRTLFDAMLLDEPRALTAQRLGMTESAVKMRQWRIRRAMRQALRQRERQSGQQTPR